MKSLILSTMIMIVAGGAASAVSQKTEWWQNWPWQTHGYLEMRGGYRLQNDQHEKDMSIMETRMQLELSSQPDWGQVEVKGDAYLDGVQEEGEFDLREANITFTPVDFADVKVGRQILTWGVGDLIFINDMFPKDWRSFFIGRDSEYLKAPSDAVKVSLYLDGADVDVVYTPRFNSDRYINGETISYWNGSTIVGRNQILQTDNPDHWFNQDELALRAYKRVQGVEYALYGYWGYWKSPGGYNSSMTQALFPKLNVYGASVQGPLGKGLLKGEIGYYDSRQDRHGTNNLINNSEMRYLIGYERELARNVTGAVQYYVEEMMDYGAYRKAGGTTRDEFRHLITLRLTRLLMNQNLKASVFTYYSPSDEDGYVRPNLHYKVSDHVAWELGANLFWGRHDYSFFGQFQDNTNAYTAIRYSF